MSVKFCARDGLLVGAELPTLGPDDPALREEDIAAGRLRGCCRIACRQCGKPVKNFPNLYWVDQVEPEDIARAYNRDDYSQLLVARTDYFKDWRSYACSCDYTATLAPQFLIDVYHKLNISWICNGHTS